MLFVPDISIHDLEVGRGMYPFATFYSSIPWGADSIDYENMFNVP